MSDIEKILESCKTVAVVGLSPRSRPGQQRCGGLSTRTGVSHYPGQPLSYRDSGREMLSGPPFHPRQRGLWLTSSAAPEEAPAIVEDAIKVGARAVWMQKRVVSEEGAVGCSGGGPDGSDGRVYGVRGEGSGGGLDHMSLSDNARTSLCQKGYADSMSVMREVRALE